MAGLTVTELAQRLARLEGDGHGAAPVFAYLGPDGLVVQAELSGASRAASHGSPGADAVEVLRADLIVAVGAPVRVGDR